jgi:hypothetical protein
MEKRAAAPTPCVVTHYLTKLPITDDDLKCSYTKLGDSVNEPENCDAFDDGKTT